MQAQRTVGVLGGSGLYQMPELQNVETLEPTTPFGPPSDKVVEGLLGGVRLLFLPRHGKGHRLPPHRVNYRANIMALKQLGAEQLVSVSAVGSLQETIHPREVVLPDQFIDRTTQRPTSFFDEGVVAHVEFADPTDQNLREALLQACRAAGANVHAGGTYVCIEGPQFSTRAESHLFRSWGAHIIGMTNLPEARLAREAELPYATLALVTDYDCWHETEASVSVGHVLETLRQNVALAQSVLVELVQQLPDPSRSPATSALSTALITPPDAVTEEAKERLGPLLRKYLGPPPQEA